MINKIKVQLRKENHVIYDSLMFSQFYTSINECISSKIIYQAFYDWF